MNKYFSLLMLIQLFSACNRHNLPVHKGNLVLADTTIQFAATAILTVDSVIVDDTFVDVASDTTDTKCKIYGPVLARSDGKIGYIGFDEKVSMYYIAYSFPRSIDEQWTGYVCNLPDRYKTSRLRVGFVGRYYAAYQYIKPRHASDAPLYLVLEKIKAL